MKGEALPKQRLRVLGVDLQGLVSISERVCVLSQLGGAEGAVGKARAHEVAHLIALIPHDRVEGLQGLRVVHRCLPVILLFEGSVALGLEHLPALQHANRLELSERLLHNWVANVHAPRRRRRLQLGAAVVYLPLGGRVSSGVAKHEVGDQLPALLEQRRHKLLIFLGDMRVHGSEREVIKLLNLGVLPRAAGVVLDFQSGDRVVVALADTRHHGALAVDDSDVAAHIHLHRMCRVRAHLQSDPFTMRNLHK
mmetsp:Transcript_69973/g.221715  ORF Transcript_69973/g.221715 Transcript_69973/m.221715 type:complete len:252 (+) Transcript_69973:254-1009(+)